MFAALNLSEELPEGDYICAHRPGGGLVRETGRDVTILHLLAHASPLPSRPSSSFEAEGVDVELIDLDQPSKPFDSRKTITRSIRKEPTSVMVVRECMKKNRRHRFAELDRP